jgi:diguanylate cyclase (GGDEF)-like protein
VGVLATRHDASNTAWVSRAQDGHAEEVLAELEQVLREEQPPRHRAKGLYAQALALNMLGRGEEAIDVARELCTLCRDLGLHAAGLQARALLVDLLRRAGKLEQSVNHLAVAAALENRLSDTTDPDVRSALAALAVALRLAGVTEEARRIELRLAAVEVSMPRHQRVARWSNLAFEHAVQGMAAARRPPFLVDADLLREAVSEIRRAQALGGDGVYDMVADEAAVITALQQAVNGSPQDSLTTLEDSRGVLERGPEAAAAQLLWGAAAVRALGRLERVEEASALGRDVLASVKGSGENSWHRVLAYEVMRVEHPDCETEGSGAAAYVELVEERLGHDVALVAALFRARVDLIRGADERRVLARAASLDSLTGLVNRRGAAAAISDAAARPPGDSVALLMIDLDGFKNVNDSCGHLAGDAVLQRVAVALRTAARVEDVVARWGGDEFLAVAVLDQMRAVALAERLREKIKECAAPGEPDRVTASIGVTVRAAPIKEDYWLRLADEAMYVAKRGGGDAVVLD